MNCIGWYWSLFILMYDLSLCLNKQLLSVFLSNFFSFFYSAPYGFALYLVTLFSVEKWAGIIAFIQFSLQTLILLFWKTCKCLCLYWYFIKKILSQMLTCMHFFIWESRVLVLVIESLGLTYSLETRSANPNQKQKTPAITKTNKPNSLKAI